MKKSLLALTVIFALLIPLNATAAVKAGASCKKAGQTSTYLGKKYTCIKSGKKLVWNKGVVVPKPKPSVTPTPTAIGDPIGAVGSTPTPLPTTTTPLPTPTPSATPVPSRTLSKFGTGQMNVEYIAPPTPTTSPSTEITDVSKLSTVEQCKIADAGVQGEIVNNPQRHFNTGFSIYKERAKFSENPMIQVVAVDFSDLQGTKSPKEDLQGVIDFTTAYFSSQSNNQSNIQWLVPDSYYRMPKPVADYNLSSDIFKGGFRADLFFNYAREAIRLSDNSIDFSKSSIIALVVPPSVTRAQIGTFIAQSSEQGQQFSTNEGDKYNLLIMGGPTGKIDAPYEYLNWAHEIGHMFGLSDLRDVSDPTKQDSSDLGVFDLMNAYQANELLAWNRFILGILKDSQVRCVVNVAVSTHHIYPVAMKTDTPKMVVIPISKYKAIIIESRRSYGYDSILGWANEGVLVYTLDTTVPYGKSAIKVISSPSATDFTWRKDAALKINESVVVFGYRITNIETGIFGDVIKVEKVG